MEHYFTRSYDVVVLGGGVTGIMVASGFRDLGKTVLLVDEYANLGGNHRSINIGDYTFDIGAFFFSSTDGIFKKFPQLNSGCIPVQPHFQRVAPDFRVYKYPYDPKTELLAAGPFAAVGSILSLIASKIRRKKPQNAEEYAISFMGSRIYRQSGLPNYITRLLGQHPRDVSIEFAEKRLSWMAKAGSFRRRLRKPVVVPPAPSKPLVRPRDGFGAMYQVVASQLEAQGVVLDLDKRINRIRNRKNGLSIELETGETVTAGMVFSTIPLDRCAALCGIENKSPLEYTSLLTLYYSFTGDRRFPANVLFNFTESGSWKRLTMHSDFYGKVGRHEYFSVEVPIPPGGVGEAGAWDSDFRSHVGRCGLFAGELTTVGSELTEFAYPIYRTGHVRQASLLREKLLAIGVESAGRQGGFDYIPTGREAAAKVSRFMNRYATTDT